VLRFARRTPRRRDVNKNGPVAALRRCKGGGIEFLMLKRGRFFFDEAATTESNHDHLSKGGQAH